MKPGKTGYRSGAKPRRENCKDELKPGKTGYRSGARLRAAVMVTVTIQQATAMGMVRAIRFQ